MRVSKKYFPYVALLGIFLFLQGCDELSECIFGVNPEIHDKRMSIGYVNAEYYETITAEVSNEVFDDSYIYNFDIYGELPPGIFFDINRRSIELYGIPEEVGAYNFTVELFVETYDEDGFDGSPTCKEYAEREFSIRVLE